MKKGCRSFRRPQQLPMWFGLSSSLCLTFLFLLFFLFFLPLLSKVLLVSPLSFLLVLFSKQKLLFKRLSNCFYSGTSRHHFNGCGKVGHAHLPCSSEPISFTYVSNFIAWCQMLDYAKRHEISEKYEYERFWGQANSFLPWRAKANISFACFRCVKLPPHSTNRHILLLQWIQCDLRHIDMKCLGKFRYWRDPSSSSFSHLAGDNFFHVCCNSLTSSPSYWYPNPFWTNETQQNITHSFSCI